MQMPMCATWAPKHCILSSLSSLQGTRLEIAANAQYNNHGCCGCASRRSSRGVAFAATGNKQKKKAKEKRKSPGGTLGRGWSFDQLMLVWDDVFDKVCEDTELVVKMRTLGQNGLERYGSGCVLLQEFVRTLPRGSASGFSNHSRRSSSKDTDEPPAYSTLSSTLEYVPRTFVNDPSLAPEEIPSTPDATNTNGACVVDVTAQVVPDIPLVKKGNLISLLRGMDRTRILGLTADESSTVVAENESATPAAVDAGGEKPYNPRNEELVLMLAVIVDNQPAVGADIIRAIPTGTKSEDGEELWKFEVKDFHTLPIP